MVRDRVSRSRGLVLGLCASFRARVKVVSRAIIKVNDMASRFRVTGWD